VYVSNLERFSQSELLRPEAFSRDTEYVSEETLNRIKTKCDLLQILQTTVNLRSNQNFREKNHEFYLDIHPFSPR
jgi:hypothetical protein